MTLEDIMPEKQSADWQHISIQDHETFVSRIGNLVLLKSGFNSKLSGKGFNDKKPVLAESDLRLTKMGSAQESVEVANWRGI